MTEELITITQIKAKHDADVTVKNFLMFMVIFNTLVSSVVWAGLVGFLLLRPLPSTSHASQSAPHGLAQTLESPSH